MSLLKAVLLGLPEMKLLQLC